MQFIQNISCLPVMQPDLWAVAEMGGENASLSVEDSVAGICSFIDSMSWPILPGQLAILMSSGMPRRTS